MKVFIDFALIPLEIKCYSILQKLQSRMLDISNCDVIYYIIYVICSHYVGKAISPLFAWPSSYVDIRIGHKWNMAVFNISYPINPLSARIEKEYITKIIPFFFCSVYHIQPQGIGNEHDNLFIYYNNICTNFS